jgi:hypothetical protein
MEAKHLKRKGRSDEASAFSKREQFVRWCNGKHGPDPTHKEMTGQCRFDSGPDAQPA